jgi:hypothetical protein
MSLPGTDPFADPVDVVVVGAGAAGLTTAIVTRRLNPSASVLVCDGAARPGAKILVSGGSRCNVTNRSVSEQDFWGGRPAIIRRVLRGLPVADTIAFFERLGVSLHEEPHGKLFPDTNRSKDVLAALLTEVASSGARLMPATRVEDVRPSGAGWSLHTPHGVIRASHVVLATGGASLPKSGSDGAGIEMARALGHTVVPITPALVPLTLADSESAIHRRLSGVSHDADVAVWIDGAKAVQLSGSMLWTHFGVSGPVVLNASRHWLRAQLEQRPIRVTLSFRPSQSFEQVEAQWTRLAAERPRQSVESALAMFVPASVASALVAAMRIDGERVLAHLARPDRRRLAHALVEWPLEVSGSRGYAYAEATAGGVALDEIDPATMASRRAAGLYLVGEILDVDGRIGGFNFQWAWSSAHVAGRALARS